MGNQFLNHICIYDEIYKHADEIAMYVYACVRVYTHRHMIYGYFPSVYIMIENTVTFYNLWTNL